MWTVLRTGRRWLCTLNKESFERLSNKLQQQPKLDHLRPYFTAENATSLYHLVARSRLQARDRLKAFLQLDRVARLETELELNIAANIKKQLSVSYLHAKDFPRAQQYGQDALKVLRMMAEPHPVELATFLHELAEVYFASERRSEKGKKLASEAIQLFEEALKLEPDNKVVTVNLAYCYTRVCWHSIFAGDLANARQFCAKAEELWNRLPERNLKVYAFFVQGKCLLLHRLKQGEEAVAASRALLKEQQLDAASRSWFLTLLVRNGEKESEKDLNAALSELEKQLPAENLKNFKQMLEGMFAERPFGGKS